MKIVHILPALTKGGGERVAVDLANQFAALGHDVAMVAGWPVDRALLADRLSPLVKLRLVNSAPPGRLAKFGNVGRWVEREWAWLAEQDVVHAHMTYGAFAAGVIRSRRRRLKAPRPAVVETCHSVGMPMPSVMRRLYAHLAANRDGIAFMAEDDFGTASGRADRASTPS